MLFSSVRNNYSDRAGWYLRGSCRQNSLPALVLIASSMTFLLICTNIAYKEPNSEFICKVIYVSCIQCPF